MTDTPDASQRSRTTWWWEAAIVAIVCAVSLFGGAFQVDDTPAPPPVAAYVIAVTSSAALLLRHRHPMTVVAVTTVVGMAVTQVNLLLNPLIVAPVVVAAYSLAVHAERRVTIGALLASAVLLLAGDVSFESMTWQDVTRLAAVAALPLLAAHLFDTRPEQSRTSPTELVETTRDALDGLRATVGLLRQSGDAAAPTEPAPGLSRLPTLVGSLRRAGLEVSMNHEGAARQLPPGVDLTAFRIVQEALTNVTKHAHTLSATTRFVWNRDQVTITVSDGGSDRGATIASDGVHRPPGYGLLGMRERAEAVGGRLSAEAQPEGGFVVTATLPFPQGQRHSDEGTAGT